MNREQWLTELTDKLRPDFLAIHGMLPEKLRVTCGWPSKGGLAQKSRVIGECWPCKASADSTVEVFISPYVSDSLQVASTLVHELVHASGAKGHRIAFKQRAVAMGLEGKMTATKAGPKLKERLNALIADLGNYPHALLDKSQSPHKKDGTRLLKVQCPVCEYTVRTTQKWLDVGLPVCPDWDTMQRIESEDKGA